MLSVSNSSSGSPLAAQRHDNDVKDCHQQYLEKNPFGYCGHGGTGVSCPVGLTSGDAQQQH